MSKIFCFVFFFSGISFVLHSQTPEKKWEDKFKQLGPELATPNEQRTASGAPGNKYWQQRADYNIKMRLDDEKQSLYGEETVTYYNNSPDMLTYIWMQLDQNIYDPNSDSYTTRQQKMTDKMSARDVANLIPSFDGGFKLDYVRDASGKSLDYTVYKTMMRVDLPQPLKPGGIYSLKLKWWYNINDRMKVGGRSGYEYFEEDDNYLYTIAQFYPRMVVYNDYEGWQHKQFIGGTEFTLNFGNYNVSITVPADHVVAATGVLQNQKEVLTTTQQQRFAKAANSDEPVIIITEDEARENEKTKPTKEKTWVFKAENVRDFAFATSRKFIWDAQAVTIGKNKTLAMSFYPKEGNPLWEQFSTRIVAHTLRTYSKYTIDYPYPVAISVHAKWIGMEYPMICFNGGRPESDGTYSEGTRNSMISVIIHEVGHNFFPMIVNSDERQWTWMDEGLNTFVQYLTEKEYDRNYPTRRGPARNIVDYMKGDKSMMAPIMTNGESLFQVGNNAYGKPATALNILRETVMGRELFDYAFKEYARRWAFKHPTPDDFFRTMEDASGVDLDWFWRGWFYGTDHCDMSLKEVSVFQLSDGNPENEKNLERSQKADEPTDISLMRDEQEGIKTAVELDNKMRDFYTDYNPYKVTVLDRKDFDEFSEQLSDEEKALFESNNYYCQVTVENVGGLIMPLIFKLEFADGSDREVRIPAEIWRLNPSTVTKVFVCEKEPVSVILDPFLETADVDLSNNYWPPKTLPSRLELFKEKHKKTEGNPMQKEEKAKEIGK